MSKNLFKLLGPVVLSGFFVFSAHQAASAEKTAPPPPDKPAPPPYSRQEALGSVINPHEQINDEGEILWGTCTICHQNTPDPQKERSIKDVRLHFPDDLNQICVRCHEVKPHPAAEGGVSATMSGYAAPDHLVAPSKIIILGMRLSTKETPLILPLDPKSGKIVCSTCHNPHERGLLGGRADYGGDYNQRLRTTGLDICQYCHRK